MPHTLLPHPILDYQLTVSPSHHYVNWIPDPNGNWLARFVFTQPTDELLIDVTLTADLETMNPFDFFLEEGAADWPFDYPAALKRELIAYHRDGPAHPSVVGYLERESSDPRGTLDLLTALNARLHREIAMKCARNPASKSRKSRLSECRVLP